MMWSIINAYTATIARGAAQNSAEAGEIVTLWVPVSIGMDGICEETDYSPWGFSIQVYVVAGLVIKGKYYHAFWNDFFQYRRWETSGSGRDVECTTIHIPTIPPIGIYSHLYVSDRDTVNSIIHTQTQWTEQGIDGILYVAHCNLIDCFTIT